MRLFSVILLISAVGAFAFSPTLERVEPRGGERGTEINIELLGKRLFSPEEIIFYRQGLQVKSLTVLEKHQKVIATIVIPQDAALGEYPLRLRCKEGLTEMRTFWVGQFPTVIEKRSKNGKHEFNDTFEKAQLIATNVTVQGVVQREDSDYYRVTMKKGQRLSVEVEGMRLGRVMFDPSIEILDSHKNILTANDDSTHLGRDCAASVLIPSDGDYYIHLRESAFEGSSKSQYRLHVGHFPRATWVHPVSGKPGESKTYTFHGDPTGPIQETITIPEEHFFYRPGHAGYQTPSGHFIRVSPLNVVTEEEPNQNPKDATPRQNAPTFPLAFEGILSLENDRDWFRFRAKKGQKLRAQVFARSLGSPVDTTLLVRSAQTKKNIKFNDDAIKGTPDSRLDFDIPEDGTFFLNIRDQLHRGGDDFRYRIELTPKPQSLHATLPSSDRNDDQKYKFIAVPRGANLAIVPNITRTNISGDLKLITPSLLPGLSVQAPPITKKMNNFPLLFKASAKAPLGGSLLPFSLKHSQSGMTGPLKEEIAHVKINNLGTYHSTSHDTIAVAIIEKAPFQLKLSLPGSPIVPNGLLPIKVSVTREKDFNAPIKIQVPYKPPGITAPNEVEIPKGKNEITLNLAAKGNIQPGDWSILVTARVNTKRGEVRLSSDLHPLTVKERYLSLTLEMATTEPGKNVGMVAKIDSLQPFEGEATVSLEALPHGVKATPQKITKDTKEIRIPLIVSQEARKGRHRNIFARVSVPGNQHPIIHQLGHGGILRVTNPTTTAKK